MGQSTSVAGLARRPDVQKSVGFALARGVNPAYFDRTCPGLLDALGVVRDTTKYALRHLANPATAQSSAVDVDPYIAALETIEPRRGAYAQVTALGLDYDEFKRRHAAQEST